MDKCPETQENIGDQICADGETLGARLPDPVPRRRRGRPVGSGRKRRVIPDKLKNQALVLKARGLPQSIIARELDLDPATVSRISSQYSGLLQELETVQEFRDAKGDLLDAAQAKVLKSLVNEGKLDKATLYHVAYALDVLYKSNRLERNQSTANVATTLTYTGTIPDPDDR